MVPIERYEVGISPTSIRFDEDFLWVGLLDGRVIGLPLIRFPFLLEATSKQRAQVEFGLSGLRWPQLDAHISVGQLLAMRPDAMSNASRVEAGGSNNRTQGASGALGSFLEFLRNLTPQILLLSIVMIMGMGLDFTKFDLSNTLSTIVFFVILFTFVLAVMANFINFVEKACQSINLFDEDAKRLWKEEGVKGLSLVKQIGKLIYRRSRSLFFEFVISLFVALVGYLVVLIASLQAASNLYTAIHGIR